MMKLCHKLPHERLSSEPRRLSKSGGHFVPMGFFSLKSKAKVSEEEKPARHLKIINTSPRATNGPIALSTPPSSSETFPSDPSPFNNSMNPPLTPPPTPIVTPQSEPTPPPLEQQNMRPRSSSAPESSKAYLKAERSSSFLAAAFSKATNGTQKQRSKSFNSSFFQTKEQRKRREKRQGKLPAILSDPDTPQCSDSEPTNSSYTSFNSSTQTEEICDPSSSTTYSAGSSMKKSGRRRRGLEDGASLRISMLQMAL